MAKRRSYSDANEGARQSKGAKREQLKSSLAVNGNNNPPRASLLGLPAELRNRIYDVAVLSAGLYTVSKVHAKQTSLLLTCSQVRNETRAMWFQNNALKLIVRDCAFETRQDHWFWTKTFQQGNCLYYEIDFQGTPTFDNTLEWLRL